jgi:hypothetical protein
LDDVKMCGTQSAVWRCQGRDHGKSERAVDV